MAKPRVEKKPPLIVMPTDFQRAAGQAFLHAVTLAKSLRTPLLIMHVIKVPVDDRGAAPDSRYLGSLKTAALLELGRLTRIAKERGVEARPLLRYGDPVTSIVETALQANAEMIVMGTEGRTGWDRLRLGSTAEGLVREAPCPVLTVHGSLAGQASRPPARVRLRRLLAVTGSSLISEPVLHLIRRLALPLRAAVCMIDVPEPDSHDGRRDRSVEKVLIELRNSGIEAEGRRVAGEPVETILAEAAAYEADLIAVGTHAPRGLKRLVLGSVTEALIRRAGCPVLTVNRHVSR
ncbi:MAG TPA: universal stress protein [Nitrospira sp.]|nr:universal stress protein [Nitrospira sp.]